MLITGEVGWGAGDVWEISVPSPKTTLINK